MRTTRAAAVTLALTMSTAIGVSACSSDDKKASAESTPTAKDAWSKAQDSMGRYKSLEVKGEGSSKTTGTLTMKGNVSGSPLDVEGTLQNAHVHLISIDDKAYISAASQFWTNLKVPSSVAKKFADTWIVEPQKTSTSVTTGLKDLVSEVRDDSSDANKKLLSGNATVAADKIGDQDAWKIVTADKKTSVWVAQNDSYDVLKTVGLGDGASGRSTTTYLSHDKDYGITAPAGAKAPEDLARS